MGKTTMKDLEERIDSSETWIGVIAIILIIAFFIAIIAYGLYRINPPELISPCEARELLGLDGGWEDNMDSEYCEKLIECIAYREGLISLEHKNRMLELEKELDIAKKGGKE